MALQSMSQAPDLRPRIRAFGPGVTLAVGLAVAAWLAQIVEQQLIGQAVIEALVIAILLGMIWRNIVGVRAAQTRGITFTGGKLLEVAVVLLGATIDLPALIQAGPILLTIIIVVVSINLTISPIIGRRLGLNHQLAVLVAVGNSICGNSAIAAVAPAIHAEAEDVASAVALTAVLGVVAVLTLPLAISALNLSFFQYGVLAGMSVYAVPQVLAATYPISAISGEIGTLVKLVRVLLLGPVVVFFSLQASKASGETQRKPLLQYVPWFVIGFIVLAALRSIGIVPAGAGDAIKELSRLMTIAAMAALGLSVDFRAVRRVGRPVAMAVMASLAVMFSLSALLIRLTGIHG